jgi:hypothetical protein
VASSHGYLPYGHVGPGAGDGQQIVFYEEYRYKAVIAGSGYMVWALPSTPFFWSNVVLSILAEYKDERVTWSKHRYNPRVFLVKLPMSVHGVALFREWAESGSADITAVIRETYEYNDYYDDPYDWYLDAEPDLDDIYGVYAEKYEKKERERRK